MRLNFRVGTTVTAAVLCLPALAAGQRPVVEGSSQRLTVACGSEGAKVQGLGNTVTLTGTCSTVLVEGSDNTVHIATVGRLTVAGMNNKVYWSAGIDGAAPKITKEGFGNTVEKKTPADSDAPTAAKPTETKPAAGTASATATGSGSSATAKAKPDNPSLTVASGGKTVGLAAEPGAASATVKRGDPAPAKPMPSSGARATGSAPASAPASAGTGLPLVFSTNQQVRTVECEGRPVAVQGNGNRLTLKGSCGIISVAGNDNILDVNATSRIDTSGNRNVVTYRTLLNDKAPVVTAGGSGNRVSKAEPQ
jgi:hypothetical protein